MAVFGPSLDNKPEVGAAQAGCQLNWYLPADHMELFAHTFSGKSGRVSPTHTAHSKSFKPKARPPTLPLFRTSKPQEVLLNIAHTQLHKPESLHEQTDFASVAKTAGSTVIAPNRSDLLGCATASTATVLAHSHKLFLDHSLSCIRMGLFWWGLWELHLLRMCVTLLYSRQETASRLYMTKVVEHADLALLGSDRLRRFPFTRTH